MPVKKYYITYGSSKAYPYQGGYTLMHARTMSEAIKKHDHRFGYTRNGNGRYCSCYTEEEFNKSYPDGINVYKGLQEIIK